jgi:hypothetical protein
VTVATVIGYIFAVAIAIWGLGTVDSGGVKLLTVILGAFLGVFVAIAREVSLMLADIADVQVETASRFIKDSLRKEDDLRKSQPVATVKPQLTSLGESDSSDQSKEDQSDSASEAELERYLAEMGYIVQKSTKFDDFKWTLIKGDSVTYFYSIDQARSRVRKLLATLASDEPTV